MTQTAPASSFVLKGWHVLAGVVAFFAVVVGVDLWFAVLAYQTFPGQVSVNPYEDGIVYNRDIAQRRAQDQLGWRAGAEVTPAGDIRVLVRDRQGAPVAGLKAQARLERPATESGRILPRFAEIRAGEYLARPGRLAGTWDLTVEFKDGVGRIFRADRRLTWP